MIMPFQRHFPAILLFCAFATLLPAQGFYDPNTIQEIKITFDFNDWDTRLDTAKAGAESYIIAKTVEINGVLFDSVGVKYKGNSSYKASNKKNPLHLELDHVRDNQAYEVFSDIKLSNGAADPTFAREVTSYWILGHYMHVPRANFAKVYINGAYYGLMTNVEHIGKTFVDNHFYSSGGAFFKCNPAFGAGPGGGFGSPNLKWLGTDSSLYYNSYELKSDIGWAELLHLIDTLNNKSAALDRILDVDRALWMLAFNDLLVNLDSYTGAFAQNYYLYRGDNRRFNSIVWDLNMSFGAFPNLGSTGGGPGGSLDSIAMQKLSPLAQATNAERPLIKKLLENATYKRMYLAHIRTILNEMIDSGEYLDKILEQQAVIDAAVQSDVNKFYTYAQFKNNVYWGISNSGGGPGFGSVPGLVSLMNGRKAYLKTTPELSAVPPVISNAGATPNPTLGSAVWVKATITGSATAVLLGWRGATSDVFTRVTMYDDGAHQDGQAADGVYGASFTAASPRSEYYIYAENANAGAFLPARAEHEFFTVETSLVAPNAGDVVINELLADNTAGSADEAGELEDWVELFNNTNSAINLTGLYLSDDHTKVNKWAFPAGTTIPANGFLVVWLDEDGSQPGLHANFKLKKSGEQVILSANNGAVLDSIGFGQQEADRSYGRFSNGTGAFTAMPTTFGAVNTLTSAVQSLETSPIPALEVLPNPARQFIKIAVPEPIGPAELEIFNVQGKLVYRQSVEQFQETVIAINQWTAGSYYAILSADSGFKQVKEFVVVK